MTGFKAVRTGLLLLGLTAGQAAMASEADGWEWTVAPYLWAASITTDMRTVTPPTDADSDSSFSDIIDKLDGVFMGRVEARRDRFSVFADFLYLGLSDGSQRQALSTDTDLDARLADVAGSMHFGEQHDAGLDVYAGLRYIDLDLHARFVPNDPDFSSRTIDDGTTYFDFLMGASYVWALSPHWSLTLTGDGSVGQTDGTWSAAAMAGYRTGNGAWLFGYRYMKGRLGSDNADVELDLSGVLFGYGFRF